MRMESLMHKTLRVSVASLVLSFVALVSAPAEAQKKYDPGATDKEIRVGTVMPVSGSFSEYAAIGKAMAAYFEGVNDNGGVNGRKVRFTNLDGGGDPKRSLEQARKLVEEEQVLLTAGIWGSGPNKAIRPYLNEKKVPQLFVASSEETFNDPAHYPWTMGFMASRRTEGQAYVKAILRMKPAARIAVLASEDEDGTESVTAIRDALGEKAKTMLVKEARFKLSDDAAVDAAVAALKESGADVFLNMAAGRSAARAIRTAYDLGWRPMQLIPSTASSIGAVLEPAGLEKAKGIISNSRSKKWEPEMWRSDAGMRIFVAWMWAYKMDAGYKDGNVVLGYQIADALTQLIRKCGDDLTRANVLKQATSLDLELGMLRDGIRVTTSPTDYRPIKDVFLVRFDGKTWVPLVP